MKKTYLFVVMLCSTLYCAQPLIVNSSKGVNMTNIGIDESKRKEMSAQLNTLLANEYMLYVKTQKYHWNVEGKLFGPLHNIFGKQYEELSEFIDHVAERVRALGFYAIGTLTEFVSHASITEDSSNPDDTTMTRNLLNDHEIIIKQIRTIMDLASKINDRGTDNMLGDMIEKHEKTAWMLRAHLN